jgi:predicted DNA-binding transcriptional regulator AlpA
VATRPRDDKQLEAALRRFFDLPARDQVRAFLAMREWLDAGAQPQSRIDTEQAERAAALEIINETARRLENPDGQWPTAREFDEANRGTGWSCNRVAKAWGRWVFALEALDGRPTRPTRAQRDLRRKIAGKDSMYEDPIVSIRAWLLTNPSARTDDSYDAWTRLANDTMDDGEALKPGSSAVRDALVIPFTEAIRVALGEIELADAKTSKEQPNSTWSTGPHQFVGRTEIAQILGMTRPAVTTLINRHDFPQPVLVLPKGNAWLLDDVMAYAEGRPFPLRSRDEFRDEYLVTQELALLLNVTPAALRQPNAAAPPRTGAIVGASIWLRSDVERWLEEHPPARHSGRARA